VSFTNASSPILAHRMYNYAAFLQRPGLSVLWNFDDGSGTIRQHLTMDTVHHYAAAGSYNVTLRDTLYGWSKRTVADTMISLGNAPEAIFFQSMTGLVGHFTDHSQGGATSWYWSFGDGTTSTQQNPYHTFATAGVYQVCLWSSNMCGVDSTCHTVVLACPLPTAAFSSNASNLDVAFTDWSTGGVTSWEWSFGDSATSTAQNPVHSYAAAGNYLVHLRTYNACGMDSSWYWLNVTCPASVAAFAATVQQFTATFHDQSTGLVTDWLWDFGDGSNSNATHPIHTYSMPGTYTVCLNTIGECGNSLICHDVEVGVTAIDLGLSNQFAIHPNPASSELHVVTQLPTADHVQLVVTDLLGSLVQRVDLGLVQSSAIDLDVHHLAAGSYLISFQTSNGTVVKRFQVVR
jgi:PKD repeat protein